jgi:hypothetical protein
VHGYSRTVRTTRGIAILLLALAAGACGKSGTDTPPPAAGLIKMSPTGVSVKLVSPGSAPRAPLRLHLGLDLTVGGSTLGNLSLPAITYGMQTVVSDTSAAGSTVDFSYKTVSVGAGGNPDAATAMRAVGKQLVGLRARILVDDRGKISSAGVQVPAGADPQVLQLIDQFKQQASNLSIPFPEEPVGKGARWTASTAITLQGTRTPATLTYVLQDVSGNVVNLQILSNAVIPDQLAAIPGLPAGTSAHVRRSELKGGGLVLTDLAQPLPTSSDQASEGTITVDVKQGTQEQRVLEKITVDIKITSTRA